MKVQTVKGPISPDEMGATITHEHIFIDGSAKWRASGQPDPKLPLRERLHRERGRVELRNLGKVFANWGYLLDNLVYDDLELAIEEVSEFKKAGGGTIVDVSTDGIGRNVLGLKEVSDATGVKIVTACGYYLKQTHPLYVAKISVKEITEKMLKELNEGIDGTKVKAGIIKVGTGWGYYFPHLRILRMHKDEEKVLKAAARAQPETEVAITIHPYSYYKHGQEALRSLDILKEEGANMKKVIMSHVDNRAHDHEYQMALVEREVYLEFDGFGQVNPDYARPLNSKIYPGWPSDRQRAAAFMRLIDEGYTNRLLVSQDVCAKVMLKRYGGFGFSHFLENIKPLLITSGVSEKAIEKIMLENPKRVIPRRA